MGLVQAILLVILCLGYFGPETRVVAQVAKEASVEGFYKTLHEGKQLFYEGDFEGAKKKFRDAFRIGEKIPGKVPKDHYLGSLKMEGLCYQYLDDLDQALAIFHEALRIGEAVGPSAQPDALNIIGWALYLKGEYDQAIEYLQKAAVVVGEGDLSLKGRILIDLGAVYSALGNYSLALKYLQDGLEQIKIYQQKTNQTGTQKMERTRALQHLGNLERSWGNFAKALEYYEEAVRAGRETLDRYKEAVRAGREGYDQQYNRAYLVEALNDLGSLYGQQGLDDQAQAAFREALTISRQLKARRLMARSLINLGNLARDEGKWERAHTYHEQALSLSREVTLRPMMGLALAELGRDLLRLGDAEQAVGLFQRALEAGGRTLSPEVKSRSYLGLANAYEALGDLEKAEEYYRLTIESIEKVRLETLSEDRKIGFWQTKRATFERAISLLHQLHQKNPQAGYDGQAFDYAERARARAFLDLLAEAKVSVRRGLSQEARRDERAIFGEMSKIRKRLLREGLSPADTAKLEAELARSEERLGAFRQRLRLTSPAYLALRYPEPLDVASVRQELLDSETLLIEYSLGKERSFLWAVSQQECQMVALPNRNEVERLVRRYRQVITSPPSTKESFDRYFYQARRLYHILLQPIEKLMNQYKRLLIVPDGILHYLPFETLVERRVTAKTIHPRFLLTGHRISYASSASVLGLIEASRNTPGEKDMDLLAYADPIFTRTRLGHRPKKTRARRQDIARTLYRERGMRLDPLPHTREEVKSIAALFPRRLSRVFIGRAATESCVKREKLRQFKCLHFATHGLIDDETPARSGLVFSLLGDGEEDGILQMSEIFNLELSADLVVLSACQSGLGKLVRGEGIIGLTRAFMYAGASSVVVSLWNVRDSTTPAFMASFYRHMRAGKSRAEALRQAKLDMIASDIPAYRFPYFWAPFIIVGQP